MKVFFDTMMFLHYKSPDQLDFGGIFGPPPHTIVIPRITLRELDKHKNTHKSGRIQERARNVLKKIERWTAGAEVRPGVSAEFVSAMPAVDYAKLGLNPDWSDDLLIAAVLQYKVDHATESVVLVTQDSGPRLTASHLNIRVQTLPDEYRLPQEPDPIELENRELAKTIATLQNARPKLILTFAGSVGSDGHACFTLPLPPASEDEAIAQKLEELRKKWPKQHPPEAAPPAASPHQARLALIVQRASAGSIAPIPPDEYERYNRDVDEYMKAYDRYLRDTWEAQVAMKRSIRFEIQVQNIGNAPAEDVDILLHFPDGFRLCSEDGLPGRPEAPRPPKKPRSGFETIAERMSFMPDLGLMHADMGRATLPVFKMPRAFAIERTGSYDVKDHFSRIKHGDGAVLPEMFLTFDSYASACSFKCQYTIRPANLPGAITGELHFVIEKENATKVTDIQEQ